MTLEELVINNMFPRKANRTGEVWVRCPWCGDDKYRMGINVINGLAHCFRASCEIRFNNKKALFRALSEVFNNQESMDDQRVKEIKKTKVAYTRPPSLPKEFEALYTKEDDNDEIHIKAMQYLINRGVTWEQIKKHKLGFCATGDYAWRIIIPIYRRSKMVAFTGRNFADVEVDPKYLNSRGIKYLYNVPRVKQNKCVLVEGPVDVWAVERAVTDIDALGRLGSGLTKITAKELRNWDEIILWPDPDKGGCTITISAAISLTKAGKKVSVIMPHDDDVDPGKLGETEEGLKDIRVMIRSRILWSETTETKLKYFAAFV